MRVKQRHYLAKGNQKIRCFVVADFIVVVVFVAKFSFLSERAKSDLGIQFPSFTHREVVFVAAFLPSLVYLCTAVCATAQVQSIFFKLAV